MSERMRSFASLRLTRMIPVVAAVTIVVAIAFEASAALTVLAAVLGLGCLIVHRAEQERAYDTLEERVHQRTAELEEANARLEQAVADREVLLKEVQHRVKNNLQVICSLLRLQATRLDAESRHGFDESMRRIQSMSLIHDLLHKSPRPGWINYADYLQALRDQLARGGASGAVRIDLAAVDWPLDVDQATPLALLASELASNAVHHAYPHGQGTVEIRLEPVERGMRLLVRDRGVGLPAGMSYPPEGRARELGLVLVQALARQVYAEVTLDRDGGTAFAIVVPPHPLNGGGNPG